MTQMILESTMALNNRQIISLLKLTVSADQDILTCDGCHCQMPEFVEVESQPWMWDQMMESVCIHLENCSLCNDDYRAMYKALANINEAYA